jgi:hypothetical protein
MQKPLFRLCCMETTNDTIWNRTHAIGIEESHNQTGLQLTHGRDDELFAPDTPFWPNTLSGEGYS